MKLYIKKENEAIVFLIISYYNYFMEFRNHKNKDEFLTLNNFKVPHTEHTDVSAQLVTIKGKI